MWYIVNNVECYGMEYEVCTLSDRPDLVDDVASLDNHSWPEFLQHSDTENWHHLYAELSDWTLMLLSGEKVIGVVFAVPVKWSGGITSLPESIADVVAQGLALHRCGAPANTLIPIAALVDPSVQGKGLSSKLLLEIKALAKRRGLTSLVVPVRPIYKSKYPIQSIQSYASWLSNDGFYYDPWLRVHQKLGAKAIHIANCTLTVKGTLAQWAKWTRMIFPHSGQYVVPGALTTIDVDKANDCGIYREPNVWMKHPMED
ncbi:hypothetical protein AB4520_06495 [Vibrio renipiscarius]|uniref:hypothetical protein n=1 Tax=Vibrio renipiscarius TaxID=1461322 RepID=UPI0035525262